MDSKDKISVWIGIVSILCIMLLLYSLDAAEKSLINIVTVIGSIASPAGLAIALVQIFKIRSSAKTYESTFNETLRKIDSNSVISTISRSLENVKLIKNYFSIDKAELTRPFFNALMVDLLEIKSNEKAQSQDVDEFIQFCALTETEIYTDSLSSDKIELSDKYAKLTALQSLLSELEGVIKKPEQE